MFGNMKLKEISYTLKFFLCMSLRKREPDPIYLILGGIVELINQEYISIDSKDKLIITKPKENINEYLIPIYDKILNAKKPQKAKEIVESFTNRETKSIFILMRLLLLKLDYAEGVTNRKFSLKNKLVPKKEVVKSIVANLREEILSNKEMSYETIMLATLLDVCGHIGEYFSKFEKNDLKTRLKEIRKREEGVLIRNVLEELNDEAAIIAASSTVSSVFISL